MVPFPHVEEQAAGHAAAVQRHGKAHGCQLLRLHGLPQREQHTQLCLHHIVVFGLVHRCNGGHGHVFHQRQRGAVDAGKFRQQGVPDGGGLGGIAAQHQQLDVGGAQHLPVGIGQHSRGKAVHLFQIALLPHACRAVTKKFPVSLMQAVDAFIVDLVLKALFQHLLFNADGLRVKAAVHKIRMEGRTQRDFGILGGQRLAFQRKGVLDAGHTDAEVMVAAHGAGVHGQVCTVELCQLFGQLGHIRAVRIAAFHHQRQKRMGSGRFTLCRESKVDADAAAVEFRSRVAGKMHARCNESTFQ